MLLKLVEQWEKVVEPSVPQAAGGDLNLAREQRLQGLDGRAGDLHLVDVARHLQAPTVRLMADVGSIDPEGRGDGLGDTGDQRPCVGHVPARKELLAPEVEHVSFRDDVGPETRDDRRVCPVRSRSMPPCTPDGRES